MAGYKTGFGVLQADKDALELLKHYTNLISRVDCNEVLEHYGAENIQPETNKGEIIHSCLLDRVEPHHSHGDSSPSASMNNEKKVYSCYSYGGGSLLWFLEQMEGSKAAAAKVLQQFVSGGPVDSEDFFKELENYWKRETAALADIPQYNEGVLRPWLAIHPYLTEERGFDPEVLMKMKVGYDERQNRIVIPHFWKGKLVGWQKRRLDGGNWWPETPWVPKSSDDSALRPPEKYKNSSGFPKDETLYNFDQADQGKPVVVVESCPSVWRGLEYGYNIVSTFGAKVTPTQIKQLGRFAEVIVFFDGDKDGWRGSKTIIDGLDGRTVVRVVVWEDSRDLAELSREEADEALCSADDALLVEDRLEALITKWKDEHGK